MPSDKNRVVVACAGSGKTLSIVADALSRPGERLLITTYTNENVDQINSYLVQQNGHVPENITVLSWYSFLLQDGVRPYQNYAVSSGRINTIDFDTEPQRYIGRADGDSYYLNKRGDIYRDRVSAFIYDCDEKSQGLVMRRLERVYTAIYVDELQDFSGYDLELLEKLFRSRVAVLAVGDPRQATFSTNYSGKNRQYRKGAVFKWIQEKAAARLCRADELTTCYRSNQAICDFADALFPKMAKTVSRNHKTTGHDGIFCIKRTEVAEYWGRYRPVVLRYKKTVNTMGLAAFNIGAMKGRTFERVLIFATGPMATYLRTKDTKTAGDLEKMYIAVTRARYSATFVV